MSACSGQTLTILVVEDDLAVAELLRTLLNRVHGWGATVVHDAAAAREIFRHVQVEALVLDVNLPGISGLELFGLLKQEPTWINPPVVLTSANADQPAIHELVQREPRVRFLPKPFDVDDVVQLIEEAVATAAVAASNPEAEASHGASLVPAPAEQSAA